MDQTTEDSREKDTFSAVVMNEAVAQPIRADSRIVVQTPIKLAGDSAAVVDGDGRIDALVRDEQCHRSAYQGFRKYCHSNSHLYRRYF